MEKNYLKNNIKWYNQDTSDLFNIFGSSEHGLTENEAKQRLLTFGANKLSEAKPDSALKIFIKQFQSPLIYILLIASTVVFFLGEHADAYIILFVLLANASIGFFQEGKAQNTLAALKKFTKTDAVVVRDGREIVVSDEEIVPGDIVILREGDKLPADVRVVESTNFKANESSLTGESVPVFKNTLVINQKDVPVADQHNMAFKGTFVSTGMAKALVVATGINTVIGKISEKITTIDSDAPLKKDIKKLSRFLSVLVFVVCIIVFSLGIFMGNTPRDMFFTSVAVAVSLIPEGLPIVITLVLATGVYRMAKRNALVKKLQAVESLGQASIIAVDKTGTITKNELMVEKVFVSGKNFEVSGNGYESKGGVSLNEKEIDTANHPELLLMGKVSTFCADARVSFFEKDGIWKVSGDPTEAAMLVFGEKIGFRKDDLEREEPKIMDIPFDSVTKFHTTVHLVEKKMFLTVVGAPEVLLSLSHFIKTDDGVKKITEKDKEDIESQIHQMSRQGLRVIACAINKDAGNDIKLDALPHLTFVGLLGMRDVLREDVAESVSSAQDNGIKVVMITGDHVVTAEAIAQKAGIFKTGDRVMTGKEIENMTAKELSHHLGSVSVFARVAPEHKLKIIEAYKLRGDIIAMTGDGVNDALSLVAADLGIAMGKIGTEVTKEAGDIVLLDDNFKSIISAIEEGRNIYASIKKVILYLFSTGAGELMVVVGALCLMLPLPLLPSQILWLNLVTDGFLVVAMAMEPREKLGKRRAQGHNSFFVSKTAIVRIIMMGFVMMLGTLFVFKSTYAVDIVKGWTMSLTVLAIFQWFNAWNCRAENQSIFSKNFLSNRYLIGSMFIVIFLQIFAVYNPFMQKILHTTALSISEWLLVLSIALSIVVVEELRKLFMRYHGSDLRATS
jgi:magnesium-transporting ATPase (P-type)